MTDRYFLFRGDELIFRNDDNTIGALGAGQAHALGQDGDVLICTHRNGLRGWHWHMPKARPNEMPWLDIQPEHLDQAKYQVLLLLQQ